MSFEHEVLVIGTPNGYLATCRCGWRGEFGEWHAATSEGDRHVIKGINGKPNRGMTLKTTVRMYRENSNDPRYSPDDQLLWKRLADELETYFPAPVSGPIEGQEALPF